MHVEAHENRFLKINDLTTVNSKFRKYQSPGFQNWAEHSLDEFIKNPSNCRNENVNHIYHDVNRELVCENLSTGLPNFERYITRDQNKEKTTANSQILSPAHYDQRRVSCGFHQTAKQDKNVVPFKLLQGRDNLYERLHGLPKQSKEEKDRLDRRYSEQVDYREFLPNSLLSSPKITSFSNSFKTREMKLYKTSGGFNTTSKHAFSERKTTAKSPSSTDWRVELTMSEFDPEIAQNRTAGVLDEKLLAEKAKIRLERMMNKSLDFQSGGFNTYIEKRIPLWRNNENNEI